ncbi:MAG: AbrB/MazE/SpoVT family DNA-binding domain-containing protein [Methylocystis sp.]|nr:AbrB/MazE/SpoVT family DNA-binding domain-containing protein [Methylocystis sp.]MBI3274538.1 AbrB/MazE/SpoVT family DNA-binding domain-containing protein [Methylocystis sp.]
MPATAKLFRNGRSQAVRLPAQFKFEGDEVYIRRDAATGDVILSKRPTDWADFFELAAKIEVPSDFMDDRDRSPPPQRDFP